MAERVKDVSRGAPTAAGNDIGYLLGDYAQEGTLIEALKHLRFMSIMRNIDKRCYIGSVQYAVPSAAQWLMTGSPLRIS